MLFSVPNIQKARRFMIAAFAIIAIPSSTSAAEEGFIGPLPCYEGVCAERRQTGVTAPLAPITGGRIVNWNPGIYLGFKPDQFFRIRRDHTSGWLSAESVIRSSGMCEPSGENFKGIRIKMEWGEYEQAPNDFSAGDALFDDVLSFLSSGSCGGKPRQFALAVDMKASNEDAESSLCVAAGMNNPRDKIEWRGGSSGTLICAARIYDPASQALSRYQALMNHLKNRYGQSPYVEMITSNIEGSFSVNNNDPLYGNGESTQRALSEINREFRRGDSRIWTTVGSNNYRAGFNGQILTIRKPAMDELGGMGVSHPDTFASEGGGNNRKPATAHEAYYHLFQGDHPSWGEWQRAGRTFDTFAGVFQSCCDPSFNDPTADISGYVQGPPPNTAYGDTHVVVITTFGRTHPVSDAIAMFNSNPRGWKTFDETCPDKWLEAGLVCTNNVGEVIP